jgi:hypothetical protein
MLEFLKNHIEILLKSIYFSKENIGTEKFTCSNRALKRSDHVGETGSLFESLLP